MAGTDTKHTPGRVRWENLVGNYASLELEGAKLPGEKARILMHAARWPIDEADKRRIAACWNACEGIPTDMLKPGLVREMTETMDILLHIIYQFDRHHVFRRMFATSLEDAGEYVAKLRGEA